MGVNCHLLTPAEQTPSITFGTGWSDTHADWLYTTRKEQEQQRARAEREHQRRAAQEAAERDEREATERYRQREIKAAGVDWGALRAFAVDGFGECEHSLQYALDTIDSHQQQHTELMKDIETITERFEIRRWSASVDAVKLDEGSLFKLVKAFQPF